ncbi:hypothetical protein AGDE_00478 [Angomonas deanei]|uniref:Leucine Rich repeat n=1 Tax=Angomonas deanei TaxID=59799 RepID=A0A7G2CLU5_9TRYP|nr:hypothetical protein AGDE_00478 [Angomonas deanei]CAD2220818.1 hypothetical protein, conserved [Angomonas deanei]|eukprot:EPY43443.1 hypothetical protein AGDE_00478 [Angomonas deanei]
MTNRKPENILNNNFFLGVSGPSSFFEFSFFHRASLSSLFTSIAVHNDPNLPDMEILRKTAALRVQKQTDGVEPEEVKEISLSGVPFLEELIAPFSNLTTLTIIGMKPMLRSLHLACLGTCPLKRLDVSDNAITIAEDLPSCPTLTVILMPNNKLQTLAELEKMAKSFVHLEVLDILDNDVNTPSHFQKCFELFPKLSVLNSQTKDGEEVEYNMSDDSSSEDEDDEGEEEEEDEETTASESASEGEPAEKRFKPE